MVCADRRADADATYTGPSPFGPFAAAVENPFSHKPSGFIGGSGHGSTFEDLSGQWWHVATQTISIRDRFERRLGLWPVYFTADGTMYVDSYLGDYPTSLSAAANPLERWQQGAGGEPAAAVGTRWTGWNEISLNKPVKASSTAHATQINSYDASLAVDTDGVRTWWAAATGNAGEWLQLDLGYDCRVSGVQINFADEGSTTLGRLAAGAVYQYYAETATGTAANGHPLTWRRLPALDRTHNTRDMPHDYVELSGGSGSGSDGSIFRHLRITNVRSGANSKFSVSGLRVFGSCPVKPPVRTRQPAGTSTRLSHSCRIIWRALLCAVYFLLAQFTAPWFLLAE